MSNSSRNVLWMSIFCVNVLKILRLHQKLKNFNYSCVLEVQKSCKRPITVHLTSYYGCSDEKTKIWPKPRISKLGYYDYLKKGCKVYTIKSKKWIYKKDKLSESAVIELTSPPPFFRAKRENFIKELLRTSNFPPLIYPENRSEGGGS